jgi:8-oxo-dGTP pyrophosphatase MutT (NUDIX family)
VRSVVEDAYGDGMTNETEPGWQTLSRREAYVGRVRIVEHEVVLPDGTSSTYEVDESVPFAVATLVVEEAQVVLARQYRYPLDRWIFDLPGGAGHATETPEDAARRELEEELGLIATELVPLQTFFVNPGRAAWPVHLFLCVTETRPGVADTSDPAEHRGPGCRDRAWRHRGSRAAHRACERRRSRSASADRARSVKPRVSRRRDARS